MALYPVRIFLSTEYNNFPLQIPVDALFLVNFTILVLLLDESLCARTSSSIALFVEAARRLFTHREPLCWAGAAQPPP